MKSPVHPDRIIVAAGVILIPLVLCLVLGISSYFTLAIAACGLLRLLVKYAPTNNGCAGGGCQQGRRPGRCDCGMGVGRG